MSESARSQRYRVNEPAVIHQAIDGELVIIHLDHGVYYSLNATGARIWAVLAAGQPVASVGQIIARDVRVPGADIATVVDVLVEQLRTEDLLVPLNDGETSPEPAAMDGAGEDRALASTPDADALTFETPVLQRYDDLQDLLLLDPIHAVDESGWPDRRENP